MNKKQKEIKLSPMVLKKLRETSGYTVAEIAKKLGISKEKIISVEEGESSFTLIQIKKLADIYKRPLAAFFSTSIPDLPMLVDYRINRTKKLSPGIYQAERKVQYLSEKIKEISEKRSEFPIFPQELNADELAKKFKSYLNVEIKKSQSSEEILKYYKEILERKLKIFIIEYPLKADDIRAFSFYSDISSIVLNEEDKASIKLFSLFHEICHLLRETSGICSLELEIKQGSQDIETFCNLFAAEFLVPLDDLKKECEKFEQINDEVVNQLTEIYGVSKQVIMIRLLWLRYINIDYYEEFKKRMEKSLKEKKSGRRNWEKVFLNRIGNFALNETKKAYNEGKITYYEASSILDLKTKYTEKFIIT